MDTHYGSSKTVNFHLKELCLKRNRVQFGQKLSLLYDVFLVSSATFTKCGHTRNNDETKNIE